MLDLEGEKLELQFSSCERGKVARGPIGMGESIVQLPRMQFKSINSVRNDGTRGRAWFKQVGYSLDLDVCSGIVESILAHGPVSRLLVVA